MDNNKIMLIQINNSLSKSKQMDNRINNKYKIKTNNKINSKTVNLNNYKSTSKQTTNQIIN